MGHTVGQVAKLAGVTVRTLRHYDEIGLLSPQTRTGAGYRRYGPEDVERLHQILLYRELGFTLDEIETILSEPDVGAREHLRRQHTLLLQRIIRLQEMAAAVEYLLEAQKVGINLTPEEKLEVFGEFDPDTYAEEAEQRWGGTDAYRESARRTARYTKDDWKKIQDETEDLMRRWVCALDDGAPAEGARAMDLAEEHRQQISRYFYECSFEIHVGLADMYIVDPRFTKNYDERRPGLAQYVHDAIHANAVARS
jgi:DNA-binding transcriptional MerR regulator